MDKKPPIRKVVPATSGKPIIFNGNSMNENRCGVCNHGLNMEHALYHRLEDDGTVTSYHIACGDKLKDIKPCPDCGQHRLLCDECRE